MNRTTSGRPRPAMATIVAFLALFVALGSTSHAAGLFTGKQIKNESITGKDVRNLTGNDVKDGSLTGADVDEMTLVDVPYAVKADNSNAVGGLNAHDLLQTAGCQSGKVLGFARIKANSGSMPDSYTSSSTYVDSVGNCSSSLVLARRLAVGRYLVKFPSNPAWLAFAQVRYDGEGADADVCAAVRRIVADGTDKGAFEVNLRQCGTAINREADFSLLLP